MCHKGIAPSLDQLIHFFIPFLHFITVIQLVMESKGEEGRRESRGKERMEKTSLVATSSFFSGQNSSFQVHKNNLTNDTNYTLTISRAYFFFFLRPPSPPRSPRPPPRSFPPPKPGIPPPSPPPRSPRPPCPP